MVGYSKDCLVSFVKYFLSERFGGKSNYRYCRSLWGLEWDLIDRGGRAEGAGGLEGEGRPKWVGSNWRRREGGVVMGPYKLIWSSPPPRCGLERLCGHLVSHLVSDDPESNLPIRRKVFSRGPLSKIIELKKNIVNFWYIIYREHIFKRSYLDKK